MVRRVISLRKDFLDTRDDKKKHFQKLHQCVFTANARKKMMAPPRLYAVNVNEEAAITLLNTAFMTPQK